MAVLVALFALMMVGLSAYGIATPTALVSLLRLAGKGPFMLIAVGVRIILAVVLWLAAPDARHPLVFQTMAVVALMAAVVLPVFGKARMNWLIEWFAAKPAGLLRAWLLLGLAFGGYLGWAVWPALMPTNSAPVGEELRMVISTAAAGHT